MLPPKHTNIPCAAHFLLLGDLNCGVASDPVTRNLNVYCFGRFLNFLIFSVEKTMTCGIKVSLLEYLFKYALSNETDLTVGGRIT